MTKVKLVSVQRDAFCDWSFGVREYDLNGSTFWIRQREFESIEFVSPHHLNHLLACDQLFIATDAQHS
jgi:hypothetical protein